MYAVWAPLMGKQMERNYTGFARKKPCAIYKKGASYDTESSLKLAGTISKETLEIIIVEFQKKSRSFRQKHSKMLQEKYRTDKTKKLSCRSGLFLPKGGAQRWQKSFFSYYIRNRRKKSRRKDNSHSKAIFHPPVRVDLVEKDLVFRQGLFWWRWRCPKAQPSV